MGGALIAETSSEATFAVRIRPTILAILTAALLACRPGADFKVSVRVIDETTGRPIPDAWVLVSARVDVEPERDPPYNRAIAGARDRTDSRGVAVLRTLEGLYWGEEPKDELWKMLSAREPKVERRITLIKEGDLFVFAKDYGVLHHPLRFKGGSSKEVPGLGLMGVKGEGTILELDPVALGKGLAVTIKMAKPEDPEYLLGSFSPDSLWLFAGLATTGATGTTKKEKAAVYDFFVENLRPLLSQSTAAYHGHMRPESLFDPESREKFINHAPEQVHNHDTTIHEWMTQKALELLPPGYEEVKQYAREIQAGVKAEDEGTRAINHFYNPYDPANAFPLGESVLKWGAIGYPDNPNNEWDWHDAQRYYREGDKAKAYKALGHVLHLLEDLSVPMHTHVIAHHSVFQRSAARYELYFGELAKANGGTLPPIYGMDARTPKKTNALADLFDGLAKLTFGRIEGDRTAVDVGAFYKWEKGSMGTQLREPDTAALDIMGKRLLPPGIECGAGLIVRFVDELRPALTATAPKTTLADASQSSQVASSSTTEAESPKVLPKWKQLERDKNRKVDVKPVRPSYGIETGLVIAFGHVIPPPYKFEYRYRQGELLVNGVQVFPSPVDVRDREEARALAHPDSLRYDKEIDELVRQVYKIHRAGESKAKIVEFLKSKKHIVGDAKWAGDRSLDIRYRWEPKHFTFGMEFPVEGPPPQKIDPVKEEEDSRRRAIERRENPLKQGKVIFFTSHSELILDNDIRSEVVGIMTRADLSTEARIEMLTKLLDGDEIAAHDVLANFSLAEWTQR